MAPRKPRRIRLVTQEYRRLMAMPDDQMAKLLAQGMGIRECCAALGVRTKAMDRYLEARLDMRKVWAAGRMKALWGE